MSSVTVTSKKVAIVWFRRDLRLYDNKALEWACKSCDAVLPIYIDDYIDDTTSKDPWSAGSASRWWLHHSLKSLQEQLDSYGLGLHYFIGHPSDILESIIKKTQASDLVFNQYYEPRSLKRDSELVEKLSSKIQINKFNNGEFAEPGSLLNKKGLPYRVFTPFYKTLRPQLDHICEYSQSNITELLNKLEGISFKSDVELKDLCLLDENRWHHKLHHYWVPGEQEAHRLLDQFIERSLDNYQHDRDYPALNATSLLSPYLHFGEITPKQVYLALVPILTELRGTEAEAFVRQLIWREFASHVLWHYPETSEHSMNARFNDSFWCFDETKFSRWCNGETGIPIVDAGMKQLWETGWMHNRVRMIVSSFLTKNLGIHWLHGARWFWETLVDADLANNSMGWQWVAGCGVDAAPYYRVFNPTLQTQKFDKTLSYVSRWAPESTELNLKPPIVDLALSRASALERYKRQIQ